MLCRSLHEMPKFHLVSWCRKFEETHSFTNRPKLCRNHAFPQNFHTRNIEIFGEISAFYALDTKEDATSSPEQFCENNLFSPPLKDVLGTRKRCAGDKVTSPEKFLKNPLFGLSVIAKRCA